MTLLDGSIVSGRPIYGSQDEIANQPDANDVPDGYVFFATDTETYYVAYGSNWFATGGGGGGGGSYGGAEVVFDTTSVPTGSQTAVDFANSGGDSLLDYTDPTAPTIIDSGIYSATVVVFDGGGTADPGTVLNGLFQIGADVGNISQRATAEIDPSFGSPGVSFAWVGKMTAGGAFGFQVWHNSGGSVTFTLEMYLEKLS